MKILGFTRLRGNARDEIYLCAGLCALMICPAFLGWSGFRPNVIGVAYGGWYTNYLSSPLGIGSGPFRSGCLLIVFTGVLFVTLMVTLDHPRTRRPTLRLAVMSFDLACYVWLLIGQKVQFVHWDSDGQFRSPSGRILISGYSSGWGFTVGIVAALFAGAVVVAGAAALDPRLAALPLNE